MVRLRVCVLAAVLVVSAVAWAQPGGAAVRGVVRTYSEAEVLAFARLQDVTKSVRWGRLIPYAGAAVAAGSLIYAALDWFYKEAQRSTGTSLDEWSEGIATGSIAITAGARLLYAGESYASYGTAWWFYKPGGVLQSGGEASHNVPYKLSITESDRLEVFNDAYAQWCAIYCADGWFAVPNSYLTTGQVIGQNSCGVVVIGANTTARCYLVKTHEDLGDWIDNHPDAGPAARGVLNDYLQHQEGQPWWPYTYEEPYGPGSGIELDPVPNINQWYDNPYANPQLDTDGDGWPDWKEVVGGTDPLDPNDYPAYDPAPGEDPNDDPLPDRDGDGIPDVYDPCPAQASNKCNDAAEPEPEIEIPDDYMRDATGQAQLDVLTEILSELREDEQDDEPAGQPDAPMPELTPLSEPSLTWTVLEDVAAQIESAATNWWADAQTRLPFALGVAWLPAAPSIGAGECQGVQMTILGQEQEVGLCGTAIDSFLAGPGRAVLLAALLVGFYLATAQVVTRL